MTESNCIKPDIIESILIAKNYLNPEESITLTTIYRKHYNIMWSHIYFETTIKEYDNEFIVRRIRANDFNNLHGFVWGDKPKNLVERNDLTYNPKFKDALISRNEWFIKSLGYLKGYYSMRGRTIWLELNIDKVRDILK